MKKLLLLSAVFFFLISSVWSQQPDELLDRWSAQSPIEKVYLHFDRDSYIAGQTAWFKAYLYSDYQPDSISSSLYAELLNENGTILKRLAMAVFFGCAMRFSLLSINYERHYDAWWIIMVALIFHVVFIMRDKKKQRVSTFIGEANGSLWMGIGFSFMVLAFIFSKIGWQYCFPFYILFYALGTFVSGSLLKFKPMIIGGAICFILAICSVFIDYKLQILLTAISILISYIIPGHLLRLQCRKQNRFI